jgi:hypothetical protein
METDSEKFFSLLQPELNSDNPQLRYQGYSCYFTIREEHKTKWRESTAKGYS